MERRQHDRQRGPEVMHFASLTLRPPAPDEVVVRVADASGNPVDRKIVARPTRTLRNTAWGSIALLSTLVAAVSYRYLFGAPLAPANVVANRFFDPWIFVHAGAASTALLLGPTQFVSTVRRRWPTAHRWLGRSYVLGCLLGGVSGVVLARGVSTGPIAAAGFGLLGLLWLYTTVNGLRTARAGRFVAHRRWMIRSFALTLGAVTLRLYLPLSQLIGVDFPTAYRAIAWLAWVPNALVAEIYLRARARR